MIAYRLSLVGVFLVSRNYYLNFVIVNLSNVKLGAKGLSILKYLLFLLPCFLVTSCIFVPFVESVRDIGATPSHRMALMNETLKDFKQTLSWSDNNRLGKFIREDKFREIIDKFEVDKDTKVIDAKIERVEYANDVYEADVELLMRRYSLNTLVVKEIELNQKWSFSLTDGWKLFDVVFKEEQ